MTDWYVHIKHVFTSCVRKQPSDPKNPVSALRLVLPEPSFVVLLQVRRDVPLDPTAFTPQLQRLPCRDRQRLPHFLKSALPHNSIQVHWSCCGTRGLGCGRDFFFDWRALVLHLSLFLHFHLLFQLLVSCCLRLLLARCCRFIRCHVLSILKLVLNDNE